MKIAIIDSDLIGRKQHRFPNLASMKISGYYKELGHVVTLLTEYKDLELYDKVFISKVFIDTYIDEDILKLNNVEYGGTGFYFDKAPNLPNEIEHHMPDYHLYDDWVQSEINRGIKESQFSDYLYNSIGFITRGCFRKCPFCVNKKYDKAEINSHVFEFFDPSRKRISLWDDNFLSHPEWSELLKELEETGRYFQFRQGLDIRLMTEEKAERFSKVKYYSDYIFAFDYIEDRELIENKLTLWKKYVKKTTKLYVFCAFDRDDKWNNEFWKQDIIDTFERIKILMKYKCIPYIMRFSRYEESPYRGMYITLARWCNQPSMFKKNSFRQYCRDVKSNGVNSSAYRYMEHFEKDYPEIAKLYYDLRYEDLNNNILLSAEKQIIVYN